MPRRVRRSLLRGSILLFCHSERSRRISNHSIPLLVGILLIDDSWVPVEAGVSPGPPITDNAALSHRPLLAPCSQLRASDTVAPVRGLCRKERTDHGRQPARVSRSVHPDHILHSPLLAPCSAL